MEQNVIADVAMVDGVISIPGMTREDILERDWNHPGLNSIRTMLVCGNLVHTKVFPLLVSNQEDFISYIAEKSLSHTIHHIGQWNDELRIVLSEPKDHTTNIDADVIEHLGKLFFNNEEFISYLAEKSFHHIGK